MAKEKLALPTLESYLKQMRQPAANVLPEWVEWVLPIALGLCVHKLFGSLLYSAGIGLGAWGVAKWIRDGQIAKQPPNIRLLFARYRQAKPLKDWYDHGALIEAAPSPVLLALEEAARCWHEARQELSSIPADASIVEEMEREIDSMMMIAIGSASPVFKREDQTGKDMKRMAEDSDLMELTTSRIKKQAEHFRSLQHDASGQVGQPSLRDRLARAKAEREAAEAELNAILLPSTLD